MLSFPQGIAPTQEPVIIRAAVPKQLPVVLVKNARLYSAGFPVGVHIGGELCKKIRFCEGIVVEYE